ncbi:MAG: prepilin-type N-terminal cleavage/methylation domain-containing protein [Candidatus Binataceae bacterium]
MRGEGQIARPRRTGAFARATNRAFTLIEIMIAVFILGLIMVMLAGSFHAVSSSKVEGENWIAVNQEGRAILFALSNEIRGAVQTPMIASRVLLIGQGGMRDGVPMDSVTVSTLDPGHRRSLEDFGPEDIVSYTTAPNPDHQGWSLLLRRQISGLIVTGANAADTAPTLVASNLLSLHMRYFDGERWSESWDSETQPPGRGLPQEVEIDVSMASPSGRPYTLSTLVSIPMAFAQW